MIYAFLRGKVAPRLSFCPVFFRLFGKIVVLLRLDSLVNGTQVLETIAFHASRQDGVAKELGINLL